MDAQPVVATAFTPSPAYDSPNLRRKGGVSPADTYYRAALVAFASIARWQRGEHLILVTDVPPPAMHAEAFATIGVDILLTPFAHRPPPGFHDRFNASLFTLDAMFALSRDFKGQPIALIDPDCVAVQPLDRLVQRSAAGFSGYPLATPPDQESNGLSAREAGLLHSLLDPSLSGPPVHYGGEFYGFTSDAAAPVLRRADTAFSFSIERSRTGSPKFNTEEHMLNFALRGSPIAHVDDLVRRIWTAPTHRTVVGDETALVLWHLPAEKDRGIAKLASVALDHDSWFWHGSAALFQEKVGNTLGVTRRPVSRRIYDAFARTGRTLQGFASASR